MGSEECLFLSGDHHQDCTTLAGPVGGDLIACREVDKTSCDSILLEDCQYSGTRLDSLEPLPGDTSSILECQETALTLIEYGVNFFAFLGDTEECQLYGELEKICNVVGGPATAPEDCFTDIHSTTKNTTPS